MPTVKTAAENAGLKKVKGSVIKKRGKISFDGKRAFYLIGLILGDGSKIDIIPRSYKANFKDRSGGKNIYFLYDPVTGRNSLKRLMPSTQVYYQATSNP